MYFRKPWTNSVQLLPCCDINLGREYKEYKRLDSERSEGMITIDTENSEEGYSEQSAGKLPIE